MVFDSRVAMTHIIQHIGELSGADRSYWFDYDPLQKTFDNSYEWCRSTVSSQQHRLRNIPEDTMPWIFGKFLKHESVVANTNELPIEALQEQVEFLEEGITSVATVPVVRGMEVCGFFGIDAVNNSHDWSTEADTLAMLNHAACAVSACVHLGNRLPWTAGKTMPIVVDSIGLELAKPSRTIEEMAQLVVGEFEKIKKSPENDRWDEVGRELFKKQVKAMMEVDKTLGLILPGFPFKSTNHVEKVLGPLPDLSEKLAVQRLHEFCRSCSEIYARGCVVVIVSDGRVFSDIAGCSPEDVALYQEAVKTWFPSPYIRWVSLADVFTDVSDDIKRERLMILYGSSLEEVDKRIKEDDDYNMMYCGFKRFFIEEKLTMRSATRGEKKKYGAAAARLALLRNEAYSNMVSHLFSTHIRLSIHPHDNVTKFGVDLVGKSDWGTPWHNAALLDSTGNFQLVRRNKAEEEGYTLMEDGNGLKYYKQESVNMRK